VAGAPGADPRGLRAGTEALRALPEFGSEFTPEGRTAAGTAREVAKIADAAQTARRGMTNAQKDREWAWTRALDRVAIPLWRAGATLDAAYREALKSLESASARR